MKRALLLAAILSGCTVLDTANLEGPLVSSADSFQSVEMQPNSSANSRSAKIGFVEFDDLGFQKDRTAVKNVFDNIYQLNDRAATQPLLLVVFIHGWHHNADENDGNVKSFKQFLSQLQYEEDNISFASNKRQVVGVYIGWRGESNESLLNPLTYRTRKLAGLLVGEYGLQEILVELKAVRNSNDKNRLYRSGTALAAGFSIHQSCRIWSIAWFPPPAKTLRR